MVLRVLLLLLFGGLLLVILGFRVRCLRIGVSFLGIGFALFGIRSVLDQGCFDTIGCILLVRLCGLVRLLGT